ncbi:MAG: glycosyltransferase family 4 protein [Desulfitobacteriaceae bacterium]
MTYLWTFFVALGIAIIATPLSMVLAKKWGAIDYPGSRRVHKRPIPRLGGLALYAAFWLAALATQVQVWDQTHWGLFIGSTLILIVGIWDDVRGMKPLVKLFWQVAAATILLLFGFSLDFVSLPIIGSVHLGSFGLVLIVFWVIGLVNTVNISDGLDGLAAGICFGTALLLFWSANRINQVPAAHLTLALAGASLGFLFYNFHPARVFMGDSGSMFLGYIIGGISIAGLLKTATILGLVFPLLVLGMPLTDLTFAIIRRKLRRRPISTADRGHLHHRLLDAGLSQRQAVLLMYGISACFGLTAVLGATGYWAWAVALLVADFALLLIILLRRTALLSAFGRRHSK